MPRGSVSLEKHSTKVHSISTHWTIPMARMYGSSTAAQKGQMTDDTQLSWSLEGQTTNKSTAPSQNVLWRKQNNESERIKCSSLEFFKKEIQNINYIKNVLCVAVICSNKITPAFLDSNEITRWQLLRTSTTWNQGTATSTWEEARDILTGKKIRK